MNKPTIYNRINRNFMYWINALLDKKGYELKKKSYFDHKLRELLQKNDFYFIQIGAHDGVRFDDLYQKVTTINVHGIVIEPIKKYFDRLKINYEDYPGVTPLNIALHPTEKEVTIHHVDFEKIKNLEPWSGGIGSIKQTHHQQSSIPPEYMTSTKVKAMTFQELIEKYKVTNISLLQIDVEGFDYEVLKMIDFDRIKPLLVKYESVNLSNEEQKLSQSLLFNYGYKIYIEGNDTIGVLYDP